MTLVIKNNDSHQYFIINKLKQLQKMKEKTEMILLNC